MKKLSFIRRNNDRHWVGDGFPVRSIFSYNDLGKEISPFLLLDYAGPENFPPSEQRRGVGAHPHRGFETVTIAYSGEVEHRDSSGGGGIVRPGDVQWMTAASGLVHEEFHGSEYAKRGGPFEMIQLRVNLSAKDKQAPPGYQNITNAQIPGVDLPSGAGTVRVIAGNYQGTQGPAHTFSPMNVWDVCLTAGKSVEFRPAGPPRSLCSRGVSDWDPAKPRARPNWPSSTARMKRLRSRRWKTPRSCSSMGSLSRNRSLARGPL
jgi:redox-sensitive bicupin YhaK (pirin superfamily)